ncbi:MAG: aminodeoxychorismate lyase [Pseudomonadales bacterium]|jgi:4-amino-4-deoxychorismate lyase|nr:aminodeoxychorismate lyase [Pseudomonadales bacterium]MBP7910052.1 aminodeoxychorismate lyase [Pseudomonadales bacterium]
MNQLVPLPRVWVNATETNLVPAEDRGLAFGDGLFETMRLHGARVPLLERHLQRLQHGALRLRIALEIDELRAEISRFLSSSGTDEGILKLIVTRGDGGRGYRVDAGNEARRILMQRPLAQHPAQWWSEGVSIRHCDTRLGSNPALAGMKHLNRLEQVLARLEWDDAQIAEGLMCDQKGRIVEGVSTNLFLVSGGRLLTPVIDHCGVAGVMRGFILDVVAPELALNTEQVHCERALLGAAQEVFLCNAVIGVWPVRQLGAKRWPLGPVTRRVQAHVAQFLAS